MLLNRRSRWSLPRRDSRNKNFNNQVYTGTITSGEWKLLKRKALTEIFQTHSLLCRLLCIFVTSWHIFLLIWKHFSLLCNQLINPQKQQGKPTKYTREPEIWLHIQSVKWKEGSWENFLPILHLFYNKKEKRLKRHYNVRLKCKELVSHKCKQE